MQKVFLDSESKGLPKVFGTTQNNFSPYRARTATQRSKIRVVRTGKKVYTTTTVGPLFSRSVARARGHRAKKAMVYTIFLGKQGKRVYTIGLERRVYTIEPQTRKKKKRRVSMVVVYTFFFPVRRFWEGYWGRVLRRVLRRGPAADFTVKIGSEKGSQTGF